jgi:hypothetical protein
MSLKVLFKRHQDAEREPEPEPEEEGRAAVVAFNHVTKGLV